MPADGTVSVEGADGMMLSGRSGIGWMSKSAPSVENGTAAVRNKTSNFIQVFRYRLMMFQSFMILGFS
jgi:hypothetical protein